MKIENLKTAELFMWPIIVGLSDLSTMNEVF